MSDGNAANSMIRNVVFAKTGQYISRTNFNYLKKNSNDIVANNNNIDLTNISPIDAMINKCKEKKYDYMSLFQDPVTGQHPISYSYNSTNNMEQQSSESELSELKKNQSTIWVMLVETPWIFKNIISI